MFDPTMLAAFGAGISSAAAFATSNALQHRAAGQVPATVKRALSVLRYLSRQRIWRVATGISTCAMVLHAAALHLGSLALVQPLMLLGVVLAIPLRAAVERKRPTPSEVRAVSVTAVGLALFVASTNPSPADATARTAPLSAFLGGCLALFAWALRASRSTADFKRKAAWLGVAAGLMYGLTAGLLKTVGNVVAAGDLQALTVTVPCLVGAGLIGVALNQRAYQIAPLAFSMPLVNVVDIVVAIGFGVVVYGEMPAHTLPLLALQASGLAITGAGLSRIGSLEASTLSNAPADVQEAWA